MPFQIIFTKDADAHLGKLEQEPALKKRVKAVKKALGYLMINPRHPSLRTHEFTQFSRELGEKVFEAYAENRTPEAYRILWHYGPKKDQITIIAITSHP